MSDDDLKKEIESIIGEIMDAWLGYISKKENGLWKDFCCWCEEIAEYRISLRQEEKENGKVGG